MTKRYFYSKNVRSKPKRPINSKEIYSARQVGGGHLRRRGPFPVSRKAPA